MDCKKIISGCLLVGMLAGCVGTDLNNKTTGTAGGAAIGAVIGQVIGKDTKGTLIGATAGALAGLGWGAYRDRQEKILKEKLENTEVEVGRNGENIQLSLPGGVTFDTDQVTIKKSFYTPLNDIASVLVEYPETRILVHGHTDSVGSESYNQGLSERRAASVRSYFIKQGVAAGRISITGHGEDEPVASNDTAEGRAQNRRVEVEILPESSSN